MLALHQLAAGFASGGGTDPVPPSVDPLSPSPPSPKPVPEGVCVPPTIASGGEPVWVQIGGMMKMFTTNKYPRKLSPEYWEPGEYYTVYCQADGWVLDGACVYQCKEDGSIDMDTSCVGQSADDLCKPYHEAHQTKACDAETLFQSEETFNPKTGKSLKTIWAEALARYKSDAYFNDPIYIETVPESRAPTRFFGSGAPPNAGIAPTTDTMPRLPNGEHGFMNLIRLGLVHVMGVPTFDFHDGFRTSICPSDYDNIPTYAEVKDTEGFVPASWPLEYAEANNGVKKYPCGPSTFPVDPFYMEADHGTGDGTPATQRCMFCTPFEATSPCCLPESYAYLDSADFNLGTYKAFSFDGADIGAEGGFLTSDGFNAAKFEGLSFDASVATIDWSSNSDEGHPIYFPDEFNMTRTNEHMAAALGPGWAPGEYGHQTFGTGAVAFHTVFNKVPDTFKMEPVMMGIIFLAYDPCRGFDTTDPTDPVPKSDKLSEGADPLYFGLPKSCFHLHPLSQHYTNGYTIPQYKPLKDGRLDFHGVCSYTDHYKTEFTAAYNILDEADLLDELKELETMAGGGYVQGGTLHDNLWGIHLCLNQTNPTVPMVCAVDHPYKKTQMSGQSDLLRDYALLDPLTFHPGVNVPHIAKQNCIDSLAGLCAWSPGTETNETHYNVLEYAPQYKAEDM